MQKKSYLGVSLKCIENSKMFHGLAQILSSKSSQNKADETIKQSGEAKITSVNHKRIILIHFCMAKILKNI